MGFSGGGSNVLKPHKHTSAVQDGSPLNMDNVTEGSLSAGDVVYSDGAALQKLAIGNVADKLEVNPAGNAPQWAAGAAGASGWSSLYSSFNFAGSLDTGFQSSWSAYRYLDIYLSGQTTVNSQIQMRIYDPDGNEYSPSQYFTYGRRLAPGPDDFVFGGGATPPSFSGTGQLDLSGGYAQYVDVQWGLFMKLQMLSPNSWAGENLVTGYYSLMAKETMIQGTFAIGRSGVTSTDDQLVQGLKLISPSTGQTGSFCQVFGAGDSTA